ncbi:MAG TPA: OsmC family protein [Chloroflexota bacterium]|nr:OsmC family protein [Chloroflexota bacterium]
MTPTAQDLPTTQPDINIVDLVLQNGMQFQAVNARGATVVLDAAPPGGEGAGMTPMELVLAALAGCTAMDVISILRKKRLTVTDYRLRIDGERVTAHPKPYRAITIRHIVTGHDVAEEAVRQAVALSVEKYCPVHAMLRSTVDISTTFEVRSSEPVRTAS